MVNVNKLRGLLVENGYNQRTAAKALDMDEHTFGKRLRTGVFSTTEIENICNLLSIKNPTEIFFAKEVAPNATQQERERS